jgi:hypothetical protein
VEQFSPQQGYKHLKTPKSNNMGIEQHQIQQAIDNSPTTGEPYKKPACTYLKLNI